MSAWVQIALTLLFWIGGIIINALIVAKAIGHYQGQYEQKMADHTKQLEEHKDKIEELNKELHKLGKLFAAWTGMA